MKKIVSVIFLCLVSLSIAAQGYNTEKTALANFLVRMYKNEPYDVKIVNDYDSTYLVSAVVLDPSKYNNSESAMLRVASVKVMSQASRYFNGSNISSDLFITTKENYDGTSNTEIIERIQENSVGYVKQLEHLTSFIQDNGQMVFIYIKRVAL